MKGICHRLVPWQSAYRCMCASTLTRSSVSAAKLSRSQFNLTFVNGTRNFSTRADFGGHKTLERLRLRDGVPGSYYLIYRSNLPNYLLFSQTFVFLSGGAVLTALALYFFQRLEKDEKEKNDARKLQLIDEKVRHDKEWSLSKKIQEWKDEKGVKDDAAKPGLDDFVGNESTQMLLMLSSFVILAVALTRIQQLTPVRIYANDKNKHCIAIKYGHILPGKITWHEFISGTIKAAPGRQFEFYSHSMFRDGSGKPLVLMDHFFRSVSDYNKIMGFDQAENVEKSDNPNRRKQ